MSQLYEKSIQKLELQQILVQLADCAGSSEGKKACMAIQPSSDLETVNTLLMQTTAASDLSTKKGYPGFAEVKDVSSSLERADRGGCLQPKELLQIAGVLHSARVVKDYLTEEDAPTVLDELFHVLVPNKYLEEHIFSAILSEEEISDNASPELASIRRHMRAQRSKIKDGLQKVISSPA